jgi:hypothetical protein
VPNHEFLGKLLSTPRPIADIMMFTCLVELPKLAIEISETVRSNLYARENLDVIPITAARFL